MLTRSEELSTVLQRLNFNQKRNSLASIARKSMGRWSWLYTRKIKMPQAMPFGLFLLAGSLCMGTSL